MSKRIGILTSGGDCAGLNAAIRAITYYAVGTFHWKVFGLHKGTTGLIQRPLSYQELTPEFCDASFLRKGGTILGSTSKDSPFAFPQADGSQTDRSYDFIEGYRQLKLDALIGIGGDGSMHLLRKLAHQGGLNLVTIPKTIDNDLGHTETAIGYHTALEIATEALDRLHSTAASHQRVMVLEVMGRDAGHIALNTGIAGGADIILIPEIPYTLSGVCQKIISLSEEGREHALIIVAEAVRKENGEAAALISESGRLRYGGIGQYLGEKIQKMTGIETRVTALGHVQRGGQPCAEDRVLASTLGIAAVNLIAQNKYDRMVAWKDRQVIDVPIIDAISNYRSVKKEDLMVEVAKNLGIYLGNLE